MIFLYSGFSDDFNEDITDFLIGPDGRAKEVTLLLQGGPGYENYLDDYLAPFTKHGINDVKIVIPSGKEDFINADGIKKIENADYLFIGGGFTSQYVKLYCTEKIKKILSDKALKGKNIAGLSAGSIIMNDVAYDEGCESIGLGLVKNANIFPHFEENLNGYELIKFVLKNKNVIAYGIETNAYIKIDESGIITKRGKGKVFMAKNIGNNKAEISEIMS